MILLKYIKIVLLVGMGVMMMQACEPNYMAYDPALKNGVYFSTDSLIFQFGMEKGEEFEVNLPVMVLGTPANYDREFSVSLIPDETTAKLNLHYNIGDKFVIKANAIAGAIPVKLYRFTDPELLKKTFVLKMKLNENENFRLVMKDTITLKYSDQEILRPRWWHDGYFGPYSQMLMMDILNNYWDMEETRPLLFSRIEAEYGRNLEKALSFPYQQEIAFKKYIITPAYEYYLANPHPRVNIPNPGI